MSGELSMPKRDPKDIVMIETRKILEKLSVEEKVMIETHCSIQVDQALDSAARNYNWKVSDMEDRLTVMEKKNSFMSKLTLLVCLASAALGVAYLGSEFTTYQEAERRLSEKYNKDREKAEAVQKKIESFCESLKY